MQITVHLLAFGTDVPIPTRLVDLPEDMVGESDQPGHLLDLTFYFGQNDFQPKPVRSVSVGDVIELPDGALHRVLGIGFESLGDRELSSLERGRDCCFIH